MKIEKKIINFIIVSLIVVLGVFSSQSAKAAAKSVTFQPAGTGIYMKVDFDKDIYAPGETMVVGLSYMNPSGSRCVSCDDLVESLIINGSTYDYVGNSMCYTGGVWLSFGTHNFTAPSTGGTNYARHTMDAWKGGLRYRGYPYITDVAFAVSTAIDNAAFVSYVNVPTSVTVGQTFTASIVMKNNGDTIWKKTTNYKLGSQNPGNNSTWAVGRIELPNDVAPGEQVTLNQVFTAPLTTGKYNFQWKMLIEGNKWFGGLTTNQVISVAAPAQIPGVCEVTENGKTLPSQPTIFCSAGTASGFIGDGSALNPWSWSCLGQNGSTISPSCSATKVCSWTPDPANTCTGTTVTQTDGCGNSRTVDGSKTCCINTCASTCMGQICVDTSCNPSTGTVPVAIGQCGTADGQITNANPHSLDACANGGTMLNLSQNAPWTWTCSGICGGAISNTCSTITPAHGKWKEVAP